MSPKPSEKQKREPRYLPDFPITPGERVNFITGHGMECGYFERFNRNGAAVIRWAERATPLTIARTLLRPCNDLGMIERRGFVRQPGYNVTEDEMEGFEVREVEPVTEGPEMPAQRVTLAPVKVTLSEPMRVALVALTSGEDVKIGGRTLGKLRALGLVNDRDVTDAGREALAA